MKVSAHVLQALDDADRLSFDSALMHACSAIDGTARKLFKTTKPSNADRFKSLIRKYYWILEPMIGAGIDLVRTHFTNVSIPKISNPDLADLIYYAIRCPHAHGDDMPEAFSFTTNPGDFGSVWEMGYEYISIPDRILYALLGIALFCYVNDDQRSTGNAYLTLGSDTFPIYQWWGQEDRFRGFAAKYNTTRVEFQALETLVPFQPTMTEDQIAKVKIISSPSSLPITFARRHR